MNFSRTIDGDKLILSPQGMIDTANAPAFEAEMETAVTATKNLELDFSQVEYISSSGLRVLLNAYKKKATIGKMTLTHVNETIMDVFKMTGFGKILTIV